MIHGPEAVKVEAPLTPISERAQSGAGGETRRLQDTRCDRSDSAGAAHLSRTVCPIPEAEGSCGEPCGAGWRPRPWKSPGLAASSVDPGGFGYEIDLWTFSQTVGLADSPRKPKAVADTRLRNQGGRGNVAAEHQGWETWRVSAAQLGVCTCISLVIKPRGWYVPR